ncbi:MAG: DUF29 domain-containing protein [Candidatus Binataceae bacterium]
MRTAQSKAAGVAHRLTGPGIEEDYYGWLLDQASALRVRRHSALDWENLAEEVEGMGRTEAHALESYLEVLLQHLLKWQFQPARRSGSWRASVQNARSDVRERLNESPSLRRKLPELLSRAYEKARRSAGAEMKLDERQWNAKLPAACPWEFDLLMREDFWPGPANNSNGRKHSR